MQLREQGAWLDGLCLGGLVWFVVGVMWLGTGVTSEIALYSSPNEGIKRSGRQGLTIGLLVLSGVFASSLAIGLFFYPSIKLAQLSELLGQVLFSWLTNTSAVMGLTYGLAGGGKAWLQHFALRLLLWHNNFAPLNYIRFLDYAAARIFLRKVGGGYIFIHRMLLEYFAARDQKQHLENLMASTQICSACGAQRVRHWRYCHHCGQPFPSDSIS